MEYKHRKSSFSDLLLIFRRNILESIRKGDFGHDLTFSQAEVLNFIGPSGKETMKNIADYLKIAPPSATEIISEMEKKGLIERKSDQHDRRIVFIALSASAKKLFASMCKRKEIILKKMTAKLSEADHKNLERIIRIIITK